MSTNTSEEYLHKVTKLRTTARAPFATAIGSSYRNISKQISIILVFILMSLPLFTTFNEILTKVVEKSGSYAWLTTNVVPFQTRAVSVVMGVFGIDSVPTTTSLFFSNDMGKTNIYFSWNCLGWQSAIMLLLTLITGLQGKGKVQEKLFVVVLGICGTYLINIIRISVVVLVAYQFGQLPATIVHDYGGTLFTVGWFLVFWWLSYNYILSSSSR